jgi:hypothetical protein
MAKPFLKLALLSALVLSCPIADAQPGASTNTLDTDQGPGPGFGGPPMGGGRHYGGWSGGQYHHSPIPNRAQVMALPSLTQAQRQDIEGIYMQAHQTMQPLIAQLRQMGGGPGGPGSVDGSAGGSPGNTTSGAGPNPQRAELMHQIREERRSTWEAVQAKLTPQQIAQLQQQATNEQQQLPPNQ